ncbi:ceramide-1-phosphate transfer protein [Bombus vosnesenskii]|uniref:Ceramide-1-phosphate transfer protein n=4 Tax=Bombus TaxID=28641 RepID=A0A6J3LRK2_9HYME|nr:ceramide-1-phosphate transfer protein [Bombus impatiens]XP_033176205.1 ceramide-1-phosphate transfer protein [Bombus impatiens]XP_033186938.1 ceramide-1-phosphate transfer protein [Bombus vancouverensis nearcticus]XP_033299038.1 ceramide-1-phosphate transfer protein [Bombus bifarius]XP_033366699.1 ceramide-1-phosphate transfer protein [Bombus vosnesenskii]XP_043598747.1 ceramide-1-phosphate transfer protein [Bombus pyrosoma]XP_043598748.1 ceramide-1-phosphate transfer protein [Bombus pyros
MAEGSELLYFDLRLVHDHFDRALLQDDDIDLRAYLDAYNELYKFFQLMGSVFGFVSSDLKEKIQVLNDLMNKDDRNYTTIKSMIEYEKENKILDKGDHSNGARTLLRLHRGLDFIREFLRQLGELSDSDKTSSCCQDAYNKTLAKHHPWVVRKAAVVAMYTMPTRELLFRKVCGTDVQRNVDVLPKMLEVTTDVFNRTHNLYDVHQLHSLP